MQSESTVPSSTPPRVHAVSSDDGPLPSSPPSSPPGFPWAATSTKSRSPQKPAMTAFSVLGKRKALGEISDNVCSKRRPKHPAMKRAKREDGKPALTQMQISLGQTMQKRCKTCGMEYVPSSEEDRKLHDDYHSQNERGYEVGRDFVTRAPPGTCWAVNDADDYVVVVTKADSTSARRKARASLDVAQRELGAVEIPDEELWSNARSSPGSGREGGRYACYMFVKDRRCVGLLLAERILEARRVLEHRAQAQNEKELHGGCCKTASSALSALRARRDAFKSSQRTNGPLRLSERIYPASIGVSRIWVSPNFRRGGVATALLDVMVSRENPDCVQGGTPPSGTATQARRLTTGARPHARVSTTAKLTHTAFSQPTGAGRRLAEKWYGRNWGWLVYGG